MKKPSSHPRKLRPPGLIKRWLSARVAGKAESAIPFFNEFKLTSPNLVVLRELGSCYKSLGNLRRKSGQEADARQWYLKSAAVWNELVRRGAATPESELERYKVEHLLQAK